MNETKKEGSDFFSLRLVMADFYMEKPLPDLDLRFSEFRGREIKRVPIIRVFGSNSDGHKTCMHIHGVFPYFYIPYEAKEFESVHKAVYQIATNLDKAINIQLGQSCSNAQHVFKVQLVKGIPFYGYHRSEHQFLKIYMFNPRFVRRAANLLQGGAVMSKNFHPYESHVPYILQFMIDYNLYGMSFIHVPMEVVKFRQSNENDQSAAVNKLFFECKQSVQFLSTTVATKQSLCALEVDIGSNFILNRFQLATWSHNNNVHSNPGIEAIWNDERLRRQKMAENVGNEKIPPLKTAESQERPDLPPTDSDIFHRTVLQSKLMALDLSATIGESQSDKSINSSSASCTLIETADVVQKRTFNLRKIIGNAIYPEECTQHENLVEASFIESHVPSNNFIRHDSVSFDADNTIANTGIADHDDSIFSDETVADEQLLSIGTQKQLNESLCAEDLELLDILQQLEEHGEDGNQIDLDSTLAPLTQAHNAFESSPEFLAKQSAAVAMSQTLADSDNELETNENDNLHDFSIVLEDMEEFILKFSSSQSTLTNESKDSELPQVDGANDFSPRKKRTETNKNSKVKTPPGTPKTPNRTNSSPKRSPRTPKSNVSAKYAPLPLKITCKTSEKSLLNKNEATPVRHSVLRNLDLGSCAEKSTKISLNKKLALATLRRKSLDWSPSTVDCTKDLSGAKLKRTPLRRSRNTADMDRTHITCELTPRRKNERVLKVYAIEENSTKRVEPETKLMSEKPTFELKNIAKGTVDIGKVAKRKSSESKGKTTPTTNVTNFKPTRVQNQSSANFNETHDHLVRKCVVRICRNTLETKQKNAKQPERLLNAEMTHKISLGQQQITSEASLVDEQIKPLLSNSNNTIPAAHNNNTIPVAHNSSEDDEILASDEEATPVSINAKRLRRSFHAVQRVKMLKNEQLSSKENIPSPNVKPENISELHSDKLNHEIEQVLHDADEDSNDADELHIQSFYDASFSEDLDRTIQDNELLTDAAQSIGNTLNLFGEHESEKETPILKCDSMATQDLVHLTAHNLPPTYAEVLAGCEKLDIPEYEFQKPFYSDPDDITSLKEIGHITLHIPGNKLNDRNEFQSILGVESKGLNEWRRQKMLALNASAALATPSLRNDQRIREYLAVSKAVTIVPQMSAPTRQDAKLWLKARELLSQQNKKGEVLLAEEESPIKVRRQKVTMVLNDGTTAAGEHDEDADILDYSTCITLTPPTPAIEARSNTQKATTTTNTNTEDSSAARSARRKRRARLSLHKKLLDSVSAESKTLLSNESLAAETNAEQDMSMLSSEQRRSAYNDSSTISSQLALHAMQRNSFLKGLREAPVASPSPNELSFGLNSVTLDATFGFKLNLENLQQAKSDVECNYITTIILELFVPTRGNLLPDPAHDEVRCLFYAIEHRCPATTTSATEGGDTPTPHHICGCIIVRDVECESVHEAHQHAGMAGTGGYNDIAMRFVQTEIEAFEQLVKLCRHWDPDIYGGYEIEMASWGYVLERSKQLGFNIAPALSRVPSQKVREYVDEDREHFTDLDIEMKLCGRILLDVWRLMRSEIALTSYTFENVVYHILHKRCPKHSYRALSEWFDVPYTRWIVIDYYLERVRGTLALLEQLDLIGRTSEMAKLIGIQFYEVLSRGSQFRVESMMLRIAKPRNLVPISPSVQQRAHMRAPEYLPLILEPQSRFYADPVIVLDFQSLYPSMIIAYNYCFSTCLGRVEHLGHSTPFEFGASQLRVSPSLLRRLIDEDLITISPCGVVFVKSAVREGILPRMLTEILDTRQMVKQSMKLDKSNSALQRVLHSRQLGLKLMANVTYGYTAANFSGRMPSVEVGDSVVAKGRETLERAIRLVESNEQWRVRVVYGDTDSLFVQVPGRNREEAFRIGAEIAEAVTKANPQPVKLKLEKVYQPCILQTKKRYVGYMYETAEQSEPVYEAKGIETVRRDGCPAVAKMLEKVLRILFETRDVSHIKKYVCRQFHKLLSGRANLQDLIFAKEFRGLKGYKPTACVPALELTRKWLQTDPRHVPRCGERVPFVIVNGPPGVPLIRLVRSPNEVLADEGLKINAIYYITKAIIPPLNRCLLLIGADVNEWFASLPRKLLFVAPIATANQVAAGGGARSTISQYFSATNCIADCGCQTKHGICGECILKPQRTFATLHGKIAKIERGYQLTQQLCQACCGRAGDIKCCSLDCPVLYVNEVRRRDLQQVEHMRRLIMERF